MSLCERDLRIYADVNDGALYHYQDYSAKIDAVIEYPDGEWLAIEIKLGANQIDATAENLISISDAIKAKTAEHRKRYASYAACLTPPTSAPTAYTSSQSPP
ncbi:MAG: hypothetical protein ACLS48_00245 [[Eubacterium] siraeum]